MSTNNSTAFTAIENAWLQGRSASRATREEELATELPHKAPVVSPFIARAPTCSIRAASMNPTSRPLENQVQERGPLPQNDTPAAAVSDAPLSRRALAQRTRRERERLQNTTPAAQDVAAVSDAPLSRRALAQRARRERERQDVPIPPVASSNATAPAADLMVSRRALAQRARRERERQGLPAPRPSTPDGPPSRRALAQRARRERERQELLQQREGADDDTLINRTAHQGGLFLAARRPYAEPRQRHSLGRMDIPCDSCGALHWMAEKLSKSSRTSPKFGRCCMEGKVQLPLLEAAPEPLQTLLTSADRDAVKFRTDIWKYNRALSFTSLGVREDHSVNRGNGPPVFRISGELHHRSGALTPPDGETPRYAQLYVIEPRAALDSRMHQNTDLDRTVMASLQQMLLANHQYVPIYKHAFEILSNYDPTNDVQVRLRVTPGLDKRRYNLPTADEVAVILPGIDTAAPRDIILRHRGGALHRISDLHPAYAPLQYPLLFPRGEGGWHPDMKLHETQEQIDDRRQRRSRRNQTGGDGIDGEEGSDDSRRLTLMRYVAYRLHYRPQETGALLRGGRLLTRYVVDMYASIDQQRLGWVLRNQDQFRLARFNHLNDANMADPDNMSLDELGQRVFLPSSYTGGHRNMTQCFQDAMTVARYFRKVDLFITMTTNPQWEEIIAELLPGQTAYDRPDLVARVFHLKKQALLDYVCKQGVFGKTVAYVYTIEFQKRGLPHIHLLIFLQDCYKLLSPEAIDSCIWARWPDPETQPLLFETVKKCMIHGPCGPEFPNAPCMVQDAHGKPVCSKGFPKDFSEATNMDGNGYPLYFRPNDGRAYEVNGRMIDNRWLVPYPPFLLAEFDCHLNSECAVSFATLKYIFKYAYKGPDRGALEVERKDEVKEHVDGRYITPPDATWRVLAYEIHEVVPGITRLQIHLPGEHMVMFNSDDNPDIILERGEAQRTMLTAFFEANQDQGPLGVEARKYTYPEFPQHFRWDQPSRKWLLRKQDRLNLGRLYFIKPTAGEIYYLRLLLTAVAGPTSFVDLRTVPGIAEPLPTFHSACLARGLLRDDGEWRSCLEEACEMHTGTRLRHLFSTLLLFGELSQPDEERAIC